MNKLLLTLALFTATIASADMHVTIQGALTEINAQGKLLLTQINAQDLTFKTVGDSVTQEDKDITMVFTLVDCNDEAYTVSIEIINPNALKNANTKNIKSDFIVGFTAEWNKSMSVGLGNNSNESVALSISSYRD